jgi:hypothetical protein
MLTSQALLLTPQPLLQLRVLSVRRCCAFGAGLARGFARAAPARSWRLPLAAPSLPPLRTLLTVQPRLCCPPRLQAQPSLA